MSQFRKKRVVFNVITNLKNKYIIKDALYSRNPTSGRFCNVELRANSHDCLTPWNRQPVVVVRVVNFHDDHFAIRCLDEQLSALDRHPTVLDAQKVLDARACPRLANRSGMSL